MKPITHKKIIVALLSTLLMVTQALAEDSNIDSSNEATTTKLTFGLGLSVTQIDDYIGSDESEVYVLPVPYFYYQSNTLKIDRNAFEGELFSNERWHLTLDATGSIPVDSADNEARKGMQDLDWVGELGPSIEYYLAGNNRSINKTYLDFSVRKAVATDFSHATDVGWTSQLSITNRHQFQNIFLNGKVIMHSALTALAYSDKYSQYFYSVSENDETALRQSYDAKGGYAGLRFSLGGTWRKDNIWVGVFTRYTHLKNASYEDSPLVKSNTNLLAGLVVSYIFIEN